MTTTRPSSHPTRRSIQLAILHSICARLLANKGSVNLGRLLVDLQHGSRASLHANIVLDWGWAFTGMNDAEVRELYELELNLLEQDHGPMTCEVHRGVKGNSALPWGYAGAVQLDHNRRDHGRTMTNEQIDELWRRRAQAMASGHPDHAYIRHGEMPMTIWHRAVRKKS